MTMNLPSDFDITPTQFCENEFPEGITCNAIHNNTYIELEYDTEVVSIEDLEDMSIDVGIYDVILKSLVEEYDYICE